MKGRLQLLKAGYPVTRKDWSYTDLFLIAFVACLSALAASTSTAHAASCTFPNHQATTDGQAQPVTTSGCGETTFLLGSRATRHVVSDMQRHGWHNDLI